MSFTSSCSAPDDAASSAPDADGPTIRVPKSSVDFFATAAPKLHSYVRALQEENAALRAQNDSLRADVDILDDLSDFLAGMSKSELNYKQYMDMKNKEVEMAKAAKQQQGAKPATHSTLPLPPLKDVPAQSATPAVAPAKADAKPANIAAASAAASSAAPSATASMLGGITGGFLSGAPAKPASAAPTTAAAASASSRPAVAAAVSSSPSNPSLASSSPPAAAVPARAPRTKGGQKRPPPALAGSGAVYSFTPASSSPGGTNNNPALRHVRPYWHEYSVFAKKRWLGRTILSVLCSDFKPPAAAGAAAGADGEEDGAAASVAASQSFSNPTAPFPSCVPPLTDGFVRLRAHRSSDAERIKEQCSDPETQRWTTVPRSYSLQHARDFLAHVEEEWPAPGAGRFWAICDAKDPEAKILGTIDLRPRGGGSSVDVGFGLHPDSRGQGMMTRALRLVCAHFFAQGGARIHWTALAGNTASWRLVWKCGFSFHGTLPQSMPDPADASAPARDTWHASIGSEDPTEPCTPWEASPTHEGQRVGLTRGDKHTEALYRRLISSGCILVNDLPASVDTILRNGDHIRQRIHRHEPPVLDSDPLSHHAVNIVAATEEVLVVDKPPGIPVHESGVLRHQSLLGILFNQFSPHPGAQLFPVHRLDKLTSGLVILARNAIVAAKLGKLIKFQQEEEDDDDDAAKEEETDAGQKKEEDDESAVAKTQASSSVSAKNITKLYLARVCGRFPSAHARSLMTPQGASTDAAGERFLLSAPLHVVNQRKGIHVVDHARGKPSQTLFRAISYDAASDTSLIEAQPLTGRTHQIRLHLSYIGHAIANDPLYGAGLFEGNSYGVGPAQGGHPDPAVANKDEGAYSKECADCINQLYYNRQVGGETRYGTHIFLHALSYSYTPPVLPPSSTTGGQRDAAASSSGIDAGFSFATEPPAWAREGFDVLAAMGKMVKSSPRAIESFRDAAAASVASASASAVPAASSVSSPLSPSPSPPPASLRLRASLPEDLEAITSIYAHHVLTGTASFEEVAPSADDMKKRRDEVLARKLPYIVATVTDEDTGGERVVGYAYANLYRPRTAYRFTLEHSVYVHPEYCSRRGIGRALLEELIAQLTAAGYTQLIAVIGGGAANAPSIALHTRCGFTHVGTLKSVGLKFGRWLDSAIMQRQLGAGASTPAAECPAPKPIE